MRPLAIYKVVVSFLFALSSSLVVPLVYSLWVGDGNYKDFLIPLLVIFLLFLPSLKLKFEDLNLKEAILSVVLVWFLFPAIASSVYILGAHIKDPIDAYFEAVSGFTTTGATILTNIEAVDKSVLLWRSLTQWLGGLGFIVFSFSVLPFIRLSYHLVKFESSAVVQERISPRIGEVVRIILSIYIVITLVGIVLLRIAGMDWYDAVNHVFAAISTGGFSPKNLSVGAFNNFAVELVLEVVMLLGSINLMVYYRAYKMRQPLMVLTYFESRSLLLITLLGTLIATAILWFNHYYPSLWEDFRYALFQVVSATTTTGFANTDFSLWPPAAQALLFILTFIGGSSSSTAGGIKQFRFNILLKTALGELKKTLHPRLVIRYEVGGKTVDINLLYGVLAFVFIYISTFVVFGFLLTLSGNDLITAFSASIACLTSFGPGLAKVGPMNNYEFMTDFDKFLLAVEMVMGRLEIFPVLALFYAFLLERD
jgi:trk system potassium uptake protein TrkH